QAQQGPDDQGAFFIEQRDGSAAQPRSQHRTAVQGQVQTGEGPSSQGFRQVSQRRPEAGIKQGAPQPDEKGGQHQKRKDPGQGEEGRAGADETAPQGHGSPVSDSVRHRSRKGGQGVIDDQGGAEDRACLPSGKPEDLGQIDREERGDGKF